MRTPFVSALALTAMASAAGAAEAPKATTAAPQAQAGPVKLTDAQLDQVSAGGFFVPIIEVGGIGGSGVCQFCGSGGGTGANFNFGGDDPD